jgi:hypothetical protein
VEKSMGQRQPASDQETEKENFGATRLTHEQKQVLSARCTGGQDKSKSEDFAPSRMCPDQLASDSKDEVLDRNTRNLGPAPSTRKQSGRTELLTPEQ